MVLVRLHGIIRELCGTSSIEVDARDVSELLNKLPEGVKSVLERFRKYVIVLVNGRRIYEDLNEVLEQHDIVDITLFVGGG